MQVVPGCVLISVIALYFVKDNPADMIAIVIILLATSHFFITHGGHKHGICRSFKNAADIK
jgi:uncharacterized membrane protein